jgi:hypothetical protein
MKIKTSGKTYNEVSNNYCFWQKDPAFLFKSDPVPNLDPDQIRESCSRSGSNNSGHAVFEFLYTKSK